MSFYINFQKHNNKSNINNLLSYESAIQASLNMTNIAQKYINDNGGNIAKIQNTQNGNIIVIFNDNGNSIGSFYISQNP